ncbi:MAG TPA: hypothetical protein VNF73_00915 [Candidatus Saccharimonadales bacterium]|nr:hypothetical protein [Candidatus Saccharimonadales bacterium]
MDLERLGKQERQGGRGTWMSPHTIDDLAAIGQVLEHARLFARVNRLHPGSDEEVRTVLAAGAQVLMLPMVATAREAATSPALWTDARWSSCSSSAGRRSSGSRHWWPSMGWTKSIWA